MIVCHPCETCPSIMTYEQKGLKRRRFCLGCATLRNNASKAKSHRVNRARFGRYYTPMKPWEKRT